MLTDHLKKQWTTLLSKEACYLKRSLDKKPSALNIFLEEKVPDKLQDTLDKAFFKAFKMIFEKGTSLLEKTYSKSDAQIDFKVNSYSADLKENKKNLKQFSKKASGAGKKNLLISGLEGIGLGVLGIGLPDIPLFTGMLLKSIYEIALHYGYDYDSLEEKYFILSIIQSSFSYGEDLIKNNDNLNSFIENHQLPLDYSQENQIENAASTLSTELLYMKFLQGLPIIGVVGGIYNPIYLHKIQSYAKLKYARRFLFDRKKAKNHRNV